MDEAEYKQALGRYLPQEAVTDIYTFLNSHSVHLHITRQRVSKLGDYRWPQLGHNYHEISVNGNMNPYQFLIVLLHEMAHLNAFLRYRNQIQPHGHEWQEEYRTLLLQYIKCYPDDVAKVVLQYTSHIPLSRKLERELDSTLHHYDANYSSGEDLTLDQLAPGTRFRLAVKPQHIYLAQERRRTRWICLNLDDNRQYLVAGTAQVKKVD